MPEFLWIQTTNSRHLHLQYHQQTCFPVKALILSCMPSGSFGWRTSLEFTFVVIITACNYGWAAHCCICITKRKPGSPNPIIFLASCTFIPFITLRQVNTNHDKVKPSFRICELKPEIKNTTGHSCIAANLCLYKVLFKPSPYSHGYRFRVMVKLRLHWVVVIKISGTLKQKYSEINLGVDGFRYWFR